MVSLCQSGHQKNTNLASLWKLLVVTDRKPGNQMWTNTNRIIPELLCELFIFGRCERLDGLLLHAHGE